MNCSDTQIPRNKSLLTGQLRNSSVVYHKAKNPFGAKFVWILVFRVLLYIMKVESQAGINSFVVRILVMSLNINLLIYLIYNYPLRYVAASTCGRKTQVTLEQQLSVHSKYFVETFTAART